MNNSPTCLDFGSKLNNAVDLTSTCREHLKFQSWNPLVDCYYEREQKGKTAEPKVKLMFWTFQFFLFEKFEGIYHLNLVHAREEGGGQNFMHVAWHKRGTRMPCCHPKWHSHISCPWQRLCYLALNIFTIFNSQVCAEPILFMHVLGEHKKKNETKKKIAKKQK